MKIYFKNGFYISSIHEQIPENAVKISEDLYRTLLEGQAEGKQIVTDEKGNPQLAEPQPSPLHHFENGQWVISPENQTALLEQQRQDVRLKINEKRDECVNGGVYVPEINKWVDTDDAGRATLVEIKADFDLNGKDNTYTLICADNSAQPLDFNQFKAVWDTVKNLKEKMFENAYMHKVLLEADDNPEHYDYSIGWAKTYQEHLNEQTN